MGLRDVTSARRRLTGLRLRALGIAQTLPASPAETVGRMLALQGQDLPGVLWSIALRSPGATRDSVEQAFADGHLVRGWPLRFTLHVTRAEDIGWLSALTAERQHAAAAGRHRELRLEPADFDRAERIARERLAGGVRLDRRDLLAAFDADGLSTEGQRGAYLLARLAQSGVAVLCGPTTWTLLDGNVPDPVRLEGAAALAELARRYLTARGPATARDLAWWAGITLTGARAAIAAVDDEFDRLDVDGVEYRLPFGLEPAPDGIHLLPGFDEYLLGYTDRSAPLAGRDPTLIVPGGNGMFLPTIVVNGEVVGTWKRTLRRTDVEVELRPFRPLAARTLAGIRRAAAAYAGYLGLELRGVVTP